MALEILIPGERRQGRIVIQTRRGTPVSNVQEYNLTPHYLWLVKEQDNKYQEPYVFFVNNPSPYYNCHGLTFGSRRSQIWDSQEILKILKEDDYQLVENVNNVQKGDIIVYFSDNGDVEHSGLVIDKREGLPLILSKWGCGKEAVHIFSMCPYDSSTVRYYRVSK
jgi:hypothetical protein